jgi:outer membrane protein OmpA-like peptidoglycan-associated protein
MSKRIVLTVAGLTLLGVGAGAVTYVNGWLAPAAPTPARLEARATPEDTVRKALAKASETATALLGSQAPARPEPGGAKAAAPFDVARINPDGTSVIAGRAAPNARLIVLADGEPIASASADENGEWVVVTDHKFRSRDPELRVAAAGTVPDPKPKAEPTRAAAQGARAETARADERPSSPGVRAITSQMMANLEQLVETAKQERAAATASPAGPVAEGAPAIKQIPPTAAPPPSPVDQPAKPSPAPAPTKIAAAEASAAVAAGTSFASADEPAKAPVSIPIPVLFVYNEAAFTEEGRRAAGLLLEYLKVKRLDAVTLSGHADERGSPSFNLDLSRERLATVASFLKSGGYAGALRLEPRGESEPFVGIDRTRFNREELYQLDRRVELRLVN